MALAVALIFALGGSAIAGPDAITSVVTKKKVKKIAKKQANKVLDRREGKLNVKSAKTAGDADKLDGKDASELETSSASTPGLDADVPLTNMDQRVVTTTITTSGTGRVIALASLEMDGDQAGADDRGRCQLQIGDVAGPPYLQEVPASGAGRTSFALTFGQELGAGTHEVALQCRAASGVVEIEEANLSAWGVGF
jgi:hypothetical protein